ncbi:hypothetical protein BC939DRAFT_93556 [Gamsiella multidivaricata]|uniref:uncharacterized protein n=1 Tax=Gamsiella multidivaricata TaxID=101098 RepID=UPI00221FAF68|nr:uncharacterized protein BC939DRAFT_93556 [Gamsiella multidivaricata]KAI7827050.1 hypothetical protein BC939DRAFT_93556 [Gamsiella multidivaricata]
MQSPPHSTLADLIHDLKTRFLTPTGLSLEYDRELHQARYALKHKKGYLESKTLYEPIDRFRFLPLDNHHHGSSTSSSTSSLSYRAADLQRQIAAHIDHIISILEARRQQLSVESSRNGISNSDSSDRSARLSGSDSGELSRSHDRTTTTSVMGILASRDKRSLRDNQDQSQNTDPDLDGFTFDQLRPHLNALDGFSQPMLQAVQQSIRQLAQNVVTLHNNGNNSSNGNSNNNSNSNSSIGGHNSSPLGNGHGVRQEKSDSLEDVIVNVRRQLLFLDRAKEEIIVQDMTIQEKALKLFDTLHQSIMVLWEILVDFMIQYQLEQDLTFKQYFAQLVDSMVLKLEILKATLQQSVYDKDTVAKLAEFRYVSSLYFCSAKLSCRNTAFD